MVSMRVFIKVTHPIRLRNVITLSLFISFIMLWTFHFRVHKQKTLFKSHTYKIGYEVQSNLDSGEINSKFILYETRVSGVSTMLLSDKKFRISWVNKPRWINLDNVNNYLENKCPYPNCRITLSRQHLEKMNALIFSTDAKLQDNLTSIVNRRNSNQVWIFFRTEAPPFEKRKWYTDTIWHKTMNWSWSYRIDSDIFLPYGKLAKLKTVQKRDYGAIFKRKTRIAAWVVSHCNTKSRREKFVTRLISAGVPVDIYGKCSKSKQRYQSSDIQEIINKHYKFYLSFENSICKDYITEKFFRYYEMDTVLIVRGGLNYSRFLDKSTFIDTSSFASIQQLADFLLKVNNSIELYSQYLRNKDKYKTVLNIDQSLFQSSCELCGKLSNVKKFHNVYNRLEDFIDKGACFQII
ncbi:alpha-(1,3)-fucosyltransferase C-like [Mercenaria mercenaria]|uniref:alpha-(1,3)-fucosyltransferase C-like n=1 Tax=Mercenaria mercenaria TaxID=6596 RepID=UPI00234F6C5E|nr:alpha-(1,3)-fucosyltransferase C-like [Mercenaria mercenaria]